MPSGPKKRRAARRNRNKKGDADYQFEEDEFNEATSTKVEDGLAVKTADLDVELAKPLDSLSSKGVALVQNLGSKDDHESVPKEEEVKEHVLESTLGGNNDKQVDQNVIIESTSIEVGDRLSGETTAATDDEKMSLPDDVVLSRGTDLIQDVGFKDVLELGSTENDGKEVADDVLDSILEKDDDEKSQAEVLDSGPVVKVEEDDIIEPTTIKVEDGLAVKTADPDIELAKEVDALSSKGVILVQNVGSTDVLESIPKEEEVKEHVLELSLDEKNDKPVDENVITESIEVGDRLAAETTAATDVDEKMSLLGDVVSSRGLLDQDMGFKDVLELGSMENDGKEVAEDVLDFSLEENDDDEKQPQAEVLDVVSLVKGKEDDIVEPTSIKVEDGLAPKTSDPDVAKDVDALSSKGIVLVQNVGSIDCPESVFKKEEMKENVLDSSLDRNNETIDENVIMESTSVEAAHKLAEEAKAAADIDEKMSLPDDEVSSRGTELVQDVGFKDVLELGSTENDGKEVAEDDLDSGSEEYDDEKQQQMEVHDSCSALKGPKKRRAAKRKTYVSPHNETDSQVEENAFTEHTSARVEDGSDIKTEADDVKSGEPVEAPSIKQVILVQDVVPKDVFELDSRGNDGKEVSANVLESLLEKDEWKDPPTDINASGPKEYDEEKPVKEVSHIEPSYNKSEDGLTTTTAADVEWANAVDTLSDGDVVVQDVRPEDDFEVGLKGNDGKEILQDVLDFDLEEDEGKKLLPSEVNELDEKENDDNLVKENVLLEADSTKLDDGLAVTTADVNSGKQVDKPPSTKEVTLVQEVGLEDAFQLVLKKNEGKEVIEEVLDSSLERVEGKEPHIKVTDSGPNENHEKPVDNNDISEASLIEEGDMLARETIGADVLEVAEESNAVSTIGTVLVQGVDFEEALDLGLREYDREEVTKDVLGSSLEEDDRKQSLEVPNWGPALKDEENHYTELTSINVEDALSTREVILVQDAGSDDVFDLGLRENEDVLDSSLNKDEQKEPPAEVNGSVANENDEKTVEEVSIIKPSYIKSEDSFAVTNAAEGIVVAQGIGSEDGFEVGLRGNDEKEVTHEVLDLSVEEAKGKEPPCQTTDSGLQENDDNLVEENVLTEANSNELEDGLNVATVNADVMLTKQVDEPSSKEVAIVQDRGFEKVFQSDLKENDRKDVIGDVLDSDLQKVEGKESSIEVHDSEAKDNNEKPVEDDIIDPTSIDLEDGLAVTTAADVELEELVEPISTEGVVLDRDLGLENHLELGSRENEGKDTDDDAIDSSLEEDDGIETHAEDFVPGSVLKGLKKRRAAKKKTNVHSHDDFDSQVEENASIKPTLINVEDGLVGKTAVADVELGESVDALSAKGVILVQDAGPENVSEVGLRANDGNEVKEDFLDSSLEKDEWYETNEEVKSCGPKENEHKSGEKVSLIEPSCIKLAEQVNTLSEWVVVGENVGSEDDFEMGTKGDDKKEIIQNVLDIGQEEDEGKELPSEVHESGPKENDDNLVEENVHIEANLTGLGLKQSDGKEDIDEVLDSSLDKVEVKEPIMEVNDSVQKENHEKAVEEDGLIDPTPIELENDLVVRNTADAELAEPVDAIPSKEVVLVQDVGSEDVLELGLMESEAKEVSLDVHLSGGIDSEDVLEVGLKESDGKEEKEDFLNSEEPPMGVFDTDPLLKGTKKRRAAKKKTNFSSHNETDSQGSRKRRAAKKKRNVSSENETDSQGSNESYDNQVEEDVLIEANSTELGFKENDGEEDIEDVLNSSLEKVEIKESPVEVNDSGQIENHEKTVDEDALNDPTPIGVDDYSKENEGKEAIQDVVSYSGIVLLEDVGLVDVLELGPEENDKKDVNEDALDSEQQPIEILDSDLILKGPKKRRAVKKKTSVSSQNETESQVSLGPRKTRPAKKKTNVSSQNETDSQGPKKNYDTQVEENVLIRANSTELEDGLAAKTVDEASTKEVSLVPDIYNEDDLRSDLKENDGKEMIEDVLGSSLEKVEGKEQPVEVNDSGPVEEDALIDHTPIKLDEAVDAVSSIEVVLVPDIEVSLVPDIYNEEAFQLDLKENDGKEMIEDVLGSSLEKVEGKEQLVEVNDSGPVEEDALIDHTPIKLDEAVDAVSSIEVVLVPDIEVSLVPDIYNEEAFQLDLKENDGKEMIEDVLGLSLEKVEGKEQPVEVNDSGLVQEDALINHTPIKLDEAVDAVSSIGVVLDRDVGFEDILEFGSKKNEGQGMIEDVTDSSSEEDDGEDIPTEGLGTGSILKVLLSLLCIVVLLVASKQQLVPLLSTWSTGSSWSRLLSSIGTDPFGDNADIEYHFMDIDEAWILKIADDVAEFAEPAHSFPSKGDLDDVSSEDNLEADSKKNTGCDLLEGNDLAEKVCDSGLMENEGKELNEENHDLGLEECDKIPVVEDPLTNLTDDLDLTPNVSEVTTLDTRNVVVSPDSMEDHSILSKELESGSNRIDEKELFEGKEVTEEHLDSSPKKQSREPAAEVLYSEPKDHDGNSVVEDPLTNELVLASDFKETEGNELAPIVSGGSSQSPYAVDLMKDDLVASKEVVQNVIELGSKTIDEKDLIEDKELTEELLNSSPNKNARERAVDVLHLGPKENDGKPVHENPLTDEHELEYESSGSTFVVESAVSMEDISFSSEGTVKNVDKPEVEDILTRELELPSDNDATEGKEMGDYSVLIYREGVQNVFELGSVSSDGENFLERNQESEKVLDKPVVKDLLTKELEMESESKETGGEQLASKEVVHDSFSEEPVEEVLDPGPKENEGKRAVEDIQADELELIFDSKEIERKGLESVVAPNDSVFQNDLLEGKSRKQNLGVDGDDLMALIKEVRKTIKEQLIVVEDMKVNLRQMLDKVNLIQTAVRD